MGIIHMEFRSKYYLLYIRYSMRPLQMSLKKNIIEEINLNISVASNTIHRYGVQDSVL